MIIDHTHNYAIQHVPKTGGTFLRSFYKKFYPEAERLFGHFPYFDYTHNYDYDLVICIRNPIDRIASLYCDMCHYEGITSFDAKLNKEYPFYSVDQSMVPMEQEWIDDRKVIQDKYCKGGCIEYFLESLTENKIYMSDIIKRSIDTAKELGRKVYILRQESLVSDLLVFFDKKNISIPKEQINWLLTKSIRSSDKQCFINAKKQILTNKSLLYRILQNEKFLSEAYRVEYP